MPIVRRRQPLEQWYRGAMACSGKGKTRFRITATGLAYLQELDEARAGIVCGSCAGGHNPTTRQSPLNADRVCKRCIRPICNECERSPNQCSACRNEAGEGPYGKGKRKGDESSCETTPESVAQGSEEIVAQGKGDESSDAEIVAQGKG